MRLNLAVHRLETISLDPKILDSEQIISVSEPILLEL